MDPATVELVSSTTSIGQDGTARTVLTHRLRHVLHAEWVTGGRFPTTHSAIRGKVTAVSGSTITVLARDGVPMTFTVTDETVVRHLVDRQRQTGSVDDIAVDDRALVSGVDTDSRTARVIVCATPGPHRPAGPYQRRSTDPPARARRPRAPEAP